jgi:OmpA-OmpF porin, OOP family
MSINLLDLAKGALTPDMISKAAGLLGESNDGTAKALSGVLPVVLGGMASSAAKPEGASALLGVLTSGKTDGILGNLGGMLGGGQQSSDMMSMGSGLIGSLFGDKAGGIANLLGSFAGIKSGSASGLMGMIAPVIMGLIGKQLTGAGGGGLNVGALTGLLGGQKDHIAAALPAELKTGLAGIPGVGGMLSGLLGSAGGAATAAVGAGAAAIGGAAHMASNATREVREEAAAAGGGIGKLIPWLLGAAVLAGLAWYFFGRSKPEAQDMAPTPAAVEEPAPAVEEPAPAVEEPAAAVEAPAMPAIDPNATAETCNAEFKTALEGKSVNFETGKAAIAADSTALLDALAATAGKCAAFKIEVAGHTDAVGAAAGNKSLSQSRASAVVEYLKGKGVAASQLTAVGYGEEKLIDKGDTEEARAKNRRIEFTVTQ